MKKNSYIYDVVIVGGGVAGCATAISLRNNFPEISVAILERKVDYYNRSSAYPIGETLPPHTSLQLQQLGIWDSFLEQGFLKSYGTAAAWGSSGLYTNEFIYSVNGYGWNLDRAAFDQLMLQEAQNRGIDFYFDVKISNCEKQEMGWNIEDATRQFSTQFIVDATGKKAAVACKVGAQKENIDQLVGIYQFYNGKNNSTSNIKEGTCIESDKNGWWYSATLPNNGLVIAYMTDADIANTNDLRKASRFNELLKGSTYTSERVSKVDEVTKPFVVAAHTQYLDTTVGEGWLAVGDATMSYDPLSSLGIFKSLATSQLASYAIKDTLNGNTKALERYQYIMRSEFKGYQQKWKAYYAQENRFKEYPFWQRRQTIQT